MVDEGAQRHRGGVSPDETGATAVSVVLAMLRQIIGDFEPGALLFVAAEAVT